MVFKKPYAFLIKYFKLINMLLVVLLGYLGYKLNLIRSIFSDIYYGTFTNFSTLNSDYIGFGLYLIIFLILALLNIILLLFKKKNKPLKDYLFTLIYVVIITIYLGFVSNIFYNLNEVIIEQTTLKLYSDISFLILLPLVYFVINFILITIGFNVKKFNFTQDINELKREEQDNEEVELIFDKNNYKYKRRVRKTIREFKYYVLENKLILCIVSSIVIIILFITMFSANIFKSNSYNKGESFVADGFNYVVKNTYETKYNLNNNLVDKDSKFVIINVNVKNNNREVKSIDLKKIRLLFGDEYVYANNYYNKYFYDLGKPYNNEPLNNQDLYNYSFIFKVPNNYKKNNYVLKFYDRVTIENEEVKGSYKELKLKVENIDKKQDLKSAMLNDVLIFGKKYGDSSITLLKYSIESNYIYNDGNNISVLKDKDINKVLLILDYKLNIDKDSILSNYYNNDSYFFNNFVSISYTNNGKEKIYNDLNVIGKVDDKIMLSIPYEVKNADKISVVFNFRDVKNIYKLK